MPYGRCIKTWARERSIALIPPHGSAKPGSTGLVGRSVSLLRWGAVGKSSKFVAFSKKHKQGIDFRRAQNERRQRTDPLFSTKTAAKTALGERERASSLQK